MSAYIEVTEIFDFTLKVIYQISHTETCESDLLHF